MGISKQSFHQYHNRLLDKMQEEAFLRVLIAEIRWDHPTMGCRDMYFKIQPNTMGRDSFETFCREEGYMITCSKSFRRTTDSSGVIRFDNLTVHLTLTAADQLWVSDITYYEVDGRFYFITFITDAFTKRILGHSVSRHLITEVTSLAALKMAIKTRGKKMFTNLIFHSDGGGQYYDKNFLKLTGSLGIQNSMCKYPWENPYAERVNGTIKNNYLKHREIETYEDLQKEVDRAVKLYNQDKPHKSLNRLTPVGFENCILALGKQSDGDKSATENDAQTPGGIQPFGLMGNNPQALISLKNMMENIV
jgi:putative transposase